MKFVSATSSILLWALHTPEAGAARTSPPKGEEDFNSGVYHGADVAEYIWDKHDASCSNISSFPTQVNNYLKKHYPTDTGNWRTDAFNVGVEAGADQVVEKYEDQCKGPIPQCSDGYDCRSCLSNPDCTWFQDIGYCETGCGMEGCGASICPEDIDTCKDCLGGPGSPASGQFSWSPYTDECLSDCMWGPADAPCYKAKSSADPSGYGPEICSEITESPTPSPTISLPIDQCSDGWNCESCTSNSECTWFADLGHCETMCGQLGCGATVCSAEITTCEECLGGNSAGQFSWSPYTSECVEDCMFAPADAPCFKGKTSYSSSGYGPEVCSEINTMHGKSAVAYL